MRGRAPAGVLVVAAGVALSGCLGGPVDTQDALPPGHDEHHPDAALPAPDLGAPDVTLEAHAGMPDDELVFHPTTLEVPLGAVVELRVANAGRAPHTFTIHDLEADTGVLAPGERGTLAFRATEAGSFEIMCDVPGHAASGMVGVLEVVA